MTSRLALVGRLETWRGECPLGSCLRRRNSSRSPLLPALFRPEVISALAALCLPLCLLLPPAHAQPAGSPWVSGFETALSMAIIGPSM